MKLVLVLFVLFAGMSAYSGEIDRGVGTLLVSQPYLKAITEINAKCGGFVKSITSSMDCSHLCKWDVAVTFGYNTKMGSKEVGTLKATLENVYDAGPILRSSNFEAVPNSCLSK
jgi:hypothetical protein